MGGDRGVLGAGAGEVGDGDRLGDGRPGTAPATIAPSSGGVPRVQSPEASAVRSSPSVSAWEARSQT